VVSVVFSSYDILLEPSMEYGREYHYDFKTGVFTSLIYANCEEYRQMDMEYEYLKKGKIYKFELSHAAGEPIRCYIDGHRVTCFDEVMKKSHLVRSSALRIPEFNSNNSILYLREYR